MIKQCKCDHPAQDKIHGNKNRVHNPTQKKQGEKSISRCSVCGSEKT